MAPPHSLSLSHLKLRLGSFFLLTALGIIGLEVLLPKVPALLILILVMALYVASSGVVLWFQREEREALLASVQRDPAHHSGLEETSTWPLVSVVVPAKNEAPVIADLVSDLNQQDYPNLEILIVNDASTDGTEAALYEVALKAKTEGWQRPLQWLTRSAEATQGKSAILNEALPRLNGQWIAVFDADAQIQPGFLTALMKRAMVQDRIAGVQARKSILHPEQNWWVQGQYFEYLYDSYLQSARNYNKGAVELRGNGLVLRRSAVEAVGGWNEASVTDDLDMSSRLLLAGYTIRFAGSTVVEEEGVLTFPALIRQRCRWGEGNLVRYLEFAPQLFQASHISHRTRTETVLYCLNFIFPLVVATQFAVTSVKLALGWVPLKLALFTLAMPLLFAICFIPSLYNGLRRFHRPSRWVSLWQALQTGVYMLLVWTVVVFTMTQRLLFKQEPSFYWAKTDHQGRDHSAQTSGPKDDSTLLNALPCEPLPEASSL
jgi:1,2-diacylglycerol 3-beta-glucosyltransferase